MSMQDKAAVYSAVEHYLETCGKEEVTVSEVSDHARATTGLDFGPVIISRYIAKKGWAKKAGQRVSFLRRPEA